MATQPNPTRGPRAPVPRTHSKRADVYVGRGAGSELYHRLRRAKRRVVAMAPYVKGHFARVLVEMAGRGVDVTLVTSEDVCRRRDVAIELVRQVRHTSPAARRWRRVGLAVSALLVISGISLFPLQLSHGGRDASAVSAAGLIGLAAFSRIRVYSYSYEFRLLRLKVVASPYYDADNASGLPLVVHAKVYVIDDEVAYLPSFNLTPEGFFDNFESCARVEDRQTIKNVIGFVETLVSDESLRVLDAATLGRRLYSEPRA